MRRMSSKTPRNCRLAVIGRTAALLLSQMEDRLRLRSIHRSMEFHRHALHPQFPHHAKLAPRQAGRFGQARHGGGAIEKCRGGQRRGARCRRQRDRCRGGDRAGARGARTVELRSRRYRPRDRPSRGTGTSRGSRFRASRTRRPRCNPLQAHRSGRGRPVRMAGGRGRRQHPRAAIVRDPVGGGRLCRDARPLGTLAAVGDRSAGGGAGKAWPAAGLVHDAEDRELGRDPAQISGERARLPA